tara:strand:- start:2586 stop:2963 length:378 start_codon:yes stop_codon:yes gene_type:complete
MNIKLNKIAPKDALFWAITRECKWDGDCDATKQRYHKALVSLQMSSSAYQATFSKIVKLINDETDTRISNRKESFMHDMHRGGDDSHFCYLPAELISQGYEIACDYLNGKLFEKPARQCFSYIFQ